MTTLRPSKSIYIIIALTLAITGFFAFMLPALGLDNNNYRFIPHDDPARLTVNYIDDIFKNTNYILVALERGGGASNTAANDAAIFEPEFLNRLYEYVEQIKTFDIVEDTNSIVSSNYIYGEDDAVIVGPLYDGEPFSSESAEELKQKILSWDFYNRTLVSDDLNSTQVMVTLNVSSENAGKKEVTDTFLKIRDIARETFTNDANVYVSGLPVISSTINESVKHDLTLLLPLVIFVVLFIMYLPVRSCRAVLYVLLPVFVSIVCTMGAMPLFNVKLSVISTVIPVVLVAVGNSYGLHIIMHYIDGLKKTSIDIKNFTSRKKFVFDITCTIRAPIALAALTTIVSFLAFGWTKVPPIREFGFFAAFGVLTAFISSITFLPAVLVLFPLKLPAYHAKDRMPRRAVFFSFLSCAILKRNKLILCCGALIIAVSAFLSSKLIVDNIFIEYFKDNADIVRSDSFIRKNFGGSKILSVMLEADSPDIILHPDTLSALENLNRHLIKNVPVTGKVMSYTDLIKRMNLVLNMDKNDLSYYAVPEDSALISGCLFFLSNIYASYANDQLEPTAVRSIIQLAALGGRDTNAAVTEIEKYTKENFPKDIKVTIGGTAIAEIATNHIIVESVWSSMIIASVCLFIIVALVNKSCVAGFLALLPLFAVVLVNFALMGALGIKLNIGTAMIFSLAMGIGIDYAIHFLESIKREYKLNSQNFLKESFSVSGAAIITDAVSTGAGFAVLLFSNFVMLAQFGALVSLSLINSAIAGLVLVPALIVLIKPRFVGYIK